MTRIIAELTASELEAKLGAAPILIPIGSLEQHGPHLPLDTDSALARSYALALADRVDGLVAPDLGYGYRSHPASGGGEIFRSTTSLSGMGLMRALYDVMLAFARHGQRSFVLANGHFENSAFAIEAAQEAVHAFPGLKIIMLNWWEQAEQQALDTIFDSAFPGWAAEHAGVVETSLMMHLHPSRVRVDQIQSRMAEVAPPSFTLIPERPGLVDPSGVLRTAHGSSERVGSELFAHVVQRSAEVLAQELP